VASSSSALDRVVPRSSPSTRSLSTDPFSRQLRWRR
jgi:hypothetical protein